MNKNPIALIAGQGNLPLDILHQFIQCKVFCCVIFIDGQVNAEALQLCKNYNISYQINGMGEIGKILDFLKNYNIIDIVFAGKVRRPSITEISVDKIGLKWLKKLGVQMTKGDNTLLKGVIDLLENEGFKVKSPHDFLNLFIQSEILSSRTPNAIDIQDIQKGKEILKTISHLDIGQAVVVQQGLILGIEAIEGTEALLKRVANLKRSGEGGVLIKMAKINQTDKIDLPTIGLDTVNQAYEAGLNGIAIEASQGYVINLTKTLEQANNMNLFLVGIS